MGPRAGLDTEDRGKILCPRRGSNPNRPVVQPVVRHYTAWATPALLSKYKLKKIFARPSYVLHILQKLLSQKFECWKTFCRSQFRSSRLNVASSSHFRASAVLLWCTGLGEGERVLQLHTVRTKFYENWSVESDIESNASLKTHKTRYSHEPGVLKPRFADLFSAVRVYSLWHFVAL
jgi:hypothetical protein